MNTQENNELKLLCESILNEEVSREMLKGYAYSYLNITTLNQNKMIAEFMGHKLGLDGDGMGEPQCRIYEKGLGTKRIEDTYSKSWDWLMPVVEKIECTTIDNNDNSDSFFNVMIEVFECNINGGDICICKSGHTKRDATYQAVVEFINQYNKTK